MSEHPHTFENTYTPAVVPRFITGMARAGTQWMCKCLNEHPDAAAFGESMFFGRRFVGPGPDGTYGPAEFTALRGRLLEHGTCIHSTAGGGPGGLKVLTIAALPALIEQLFPDSAPRSTPGEVFRRLAHAIAEREGKPIAIEKTPHHLNWIDRIHAALPEARFVIMIREPYSFMLSYKHQGDRKAERIQRAFARRYHPVACALIWKSSLLAAKVALTRHSARAMLINFDDLRADPHATLGRIQEFFGLAPVNLADAVPPDNTSFPSGLRPALQPEDIFWMNRIAGRTMRRHEYAITPTPFAAARILWSLLRLPWWAIRNYLNLRSRVSGSTATYLLHWFRRNSSREELRNRP